MKYTTVLSETVFGPFPINTGLGGAQTLSCNFRLAFSRATPEVGKGQIRGAFGRATATAQSK